MKRFKHSDLVDSKLHQLFQKLSMQSKEAIIDEYEFDEFKDYMHIEREIERKFENKINDQLIKHPKNLLLIVGNVGDGKSHMLSYMNQKYSAIFRKKNVRIHNDATETDSPTSTSIDTMLKLLEPFTDDNLKDNQIDRLIVAINLGVLTNLINELEKTNKFTELIDYIKESYILEKRKYKKIKHGCFNIVSFNAEERFKLKQGAFESNLYSEALERIFSQADNNVFYQAYLEDINNNINTILHKNYEFLLKDSIQNTIIYLLIRTEIEHKEIISVRDLLNFFYDICIPIENTKEPFYYLPYLLFENPSKSHLLSLMNKSDPSRLQSREINEIAIELYHSPNIYEEITKIINRENKIFEKVFDGILKEDREHKLAKANFEQYLNSYLRILFLTDYNNMFFYDEVFINYISFYEHIKASKGYRDLMKLIESAMSSWNGKSLKKNHIIKDTSNNNMKLLVNIDLEYDKPITVDNEIIITFNITDFKYDLVIDFKVFEVLTKVENGYFLKDKDYQQAIRFDRFVDFYLNNHTLMDKNFLYNIETNKTYILEDDHGDIILREEGS